MSNLVKVTDDLFVLLRSIRDTFFRPAEVITRSHLSHTQFHAISTLAYKGPMSMSELASEMKISKQQLTPLICKLISSNMVVRKQQEQDRRIVLIEITGPGRETLAKITGEIKQSVMNRLGKLSDSDLNNLDLGLAHIREILQNIK
jgi:DNA-binding MarR family transcriptional regulator